MRRRASSLSASHDLQQPLQAASLYFDQILDSTDTAQRERAMAGARSAFASTQRLLETMLDHLRLEAGAAPVRIEPVALDETAGGHRARTRRRRTRRRHADQGGADAPSAYSADRAMLKRIHRQPGRPTRSGMRQGERILIGARRRRGRAEVWVIDDGNGIAAADVDPIFDDYARGATIAGPSAAGSASASPRPGAWRT